MCNGANRTGNTLWRRLTEERSGGAKSVFHFDVQGSVVKSTHSGIPWIRYLRQNLGDRIHFWPFDGWDIPSGKSAIVEVYPSLWSKGFVREDRTQNQHDAYSVVAWLRQADLDGKLPTHLNPLLTGAERTLAHVEGWILGIMRAYKECSMTKADIAEQIQTGTGLSKKESVEMMEAVFSTMKATLESGEPLKISGFGSFIVKQKADRRGRNPQTGEAMTIEARRILTFKPSTVLRHAINRITA